MEKLADIQPINPLTMPIHAGITRIWVFDPTSRTRDGNLNIRIHMRTTDDKTLSFDMFVSEQTLRDMSRSTNIPIEMQGGMWITRSSREVAEVEEDILPKEIHKSSRTEIEVASFSYYEGIKLAKKLGLKNRGNCEKGNYMVCCGDVMFQVLPTDYPQVERTVV